MVDREHGRGASDVARRGLEFGEAVSSLFDSDELPERVEALGEVAAVRDQTPELTPQLRELLADESTPSRLRHAVAIELEGRGDVEGLMRSLHTPDNIALRGVLSALGRIGPEEALAEIERSEAPQATPEAARWAMRLLAYRYHRDDNDVLLDIPELLGHMVEPGDPEEVGAQSAAEEEARRAVREVERELPAIPISTRGGVGFTCGEQRHVALPAGEPGEIARTASEAPQVAAVVAAEFPPEPRFGPRYLVLTQPVEHDVGVALTTMSGFVRGVGTADAGRGELRGSLTSKRAPGGVVFVADFRADSDGFVIERLAIDGRVPSLQIQDDAVED